MKQKIHRLLLQCNDWLTKYYRNNIEHQARALSHEDIVVLLGQLAAHKNLAIYLVDRKSREQRFRLLHDLLLELGIQAFITTPLGKEDSAVVNRLVQHTLNLAKQAQWN